MLPCTKSYLTKPTLKQKLKGRGGTCFKRKAWRFHVPILTAGTGVPLEIKRGDGTERNEGNKGQPHFHSHVFMIPYKEDKKAKVKKGWLAVEVGLEEEGEFQRFEIPISYLYHPLFRRLLEKAHEVYGYHTTGPLRLPCSTDDFLNLKWRIEKESNHHNHHHHHHHHLPLTLSFHSC
ncbi:Small auxin-up RNA - like 5 [Theobroma cacao]|nr:Small auxin-up RNA - like 5 [Theobroma cacao]